jgi:hypothetical protein
LKQQRPWQRISNAIEWAKNFAIKAAMLSEKNAKKPFPHLGIICRTVFHLKIFQVIFNHYVNSCNLVEIQKTSTWGIIKICFFKPQQIKNLSKTIKSFTYDNKRAF